jgi:hypothetical protein
MSNLVTAPENNGQSRNSVKKIGYLLPSKSKINIKSGIVDQVYDTATKPTE